VIRIHHFPGRLLHIMSLRVYDLKSLRQTVKDNFDKYQAVAEIQTNDLNRAFHESQSITENWWIKPGIKFLGSPDYGNDGCRSTMMGDVLEICGEYSSVKYIVAPSGYLHLENIQ
jgi:hypothetical protein